MTSKKQKRPSPKNRPTFGRIMSWHRSVSPIITLWPFPHPLLYSLRPMRWFWHPSEIGTLLVVSVERKVWWKFEELGRPCIRQVELGLLRIYPRGAQMPNRSRTGEDVLYRQCASHLLSSSYHARYIWLSRKLRIRRLSNDDPQTLLGGTVTLSPICKHFRFTTKSRSTKRIPDEFINESNLR